MQSSKCKFFHIQREVNGTRQFLVGENRDTFSDGHNPFCNDIYEAFNRKEQELTDVLSRSHRDPSLIEKLKKILFFQELARDREDIFEKVRKSINLELPSRLRCIWLCNEESLEHWWNWISKSKGGSELEILAIEIDEENKIHYADPKHLQIQYGCRDLGMKYTPVLDIESNARKYWSSKPTVGEPYEILFEGSFNILEKYNSIDEIGSSVNR